MKQVHFRVAPKAGVLYFGEVAWVVILEIPVGIVSFQFLKFLLKF